MRTTITLIVALCCLSANAQLVNGSFEQNGIPSLAGWDMACTCGVPASSSDTPGGTGDWSFQMNSAGNGCICFISGPNKQAVPWLTPGEWRISGWIKGYGPDDLDATMALVVSGLDPFVPNTLGGIGTLDSVWAYRENTFSVPVGVDPDSLFLLLFASGNSVGVRPVFFDDLQITAETSTALNDDRTETLPHARPDPAHDRLWVDVPEAPLSITAIDASGRLHELKNFTHGERTLEVDVNGLANGIQLLRIVSSSTTRTLRFIKA